MIHPSLHDGGPANDPAQVVSGDGTEILVPASPSRRYLIIFWPSTHTEPMFLRLHATAAARIGSGIRIDPGGFHEITYWNLYKGTIRAITADAAGDVQWQEGR